MKSYYAEAVKIDPEDGFWKRPDGDWELMLHHELKNVTVPMISWWFDNIDTTERYKLWDPNNHLKFEWIVDPHTNGHVGAVHKVRQKMAGIPMNMRFCYTEPHETDRTPGYDNIITADCCGLLIGKIIRARYIYEWKQTDYGVLVNSRYIIAGWALKFFCKSVYDHDYPEQKRLQEFLPDLYNQSCT
ncbi:MAG: DAPG hydrolase family protein [Ruminococcus sp.]